MLIFSGIHSNVLESEQVCLESIKLLGIRIGYMDTVVESTRKFQCNMVDNNGMTINKK